MKYKLLLLDVDGVLVKNKDAPLSPRVIRCLQKIKKSIFITLCTGRVYKDLKHIIDSLGINQSYHVIESGAKVLNPSGKEEQVKAIPFDEVKEIIRVAEDTPVGYGFCVNGEWYANVKDARKGQVTTVSLSSHSKEQTQSILAKIKPLSERYHVAVGSHWEIPEGNFILITNPEASKGHAIAYVQDKLCLTKEETVGVGDMPNDLPLFERSGFKVAMGNAHEELKRKADYIAPPIEKDGVADVVEKYLLQQVPT